MKRCSRAGLSKNPVDRIEQVFGHAVRKLDCVFRARFAVQWIARNEHREQAQRAAKFDVGKGVADHATAPSLDLRKLPLRLMKHARLRLATIALLPVMRTEIKRIHMRAARGQFPLEIAVNFGDCFRRVFAQRNAALVGNHDYAQPGAIEPGNGQGRTGQQHKTLPGRDVFALRQLLVDDAIAIQKCCMKANTRERRNILCRGIPRGTIRGSEHPVIITRAES